MPYVKFTGSEEVEVPDLRVIVKPGDVIEVDDAQVEGLLCQETNWKKATAPKAQKQEG